MSVYAIGDIQGCYDALQRLLERLRFDPASDRLWLVGDLVNRGPKSLQVLRFVKGLGEAAVTVLGNHDLHALARAGGVDRRRRSDTIDDLLRAPDAGELLHWLRHRPLLHRDPALGWTMVHAGLLPQWDLDEAQALAREAEAVLRSAEHAELFRHMYGDEPDHWIPGHSGWARLRVIINAFTRLRYCSRDGRMDLGPKGAPGTQPPGLLPWFRVPGRRSAGERIVFGHWSTLGCIQEHDLLSLDTGCIWGGRLTAARLDGPGRQILAVDCPRGLVPGSHA